MKVYFFTRNEIPSNKGYTTLTGVGNAAGIKSPSLSTGKRVFLRDGVVIRIHELEVVKLKRNGEHWRPSQTYLAPVKQLCKFDMT